MRNNAEPNCEMQPCQFSSSSKQEDPVVSLFPPHPIFFNLYVLELHVDKRKAEILTRVSHAYPYNFVDVFSFIRYRCHRYSNCELIVSGLLPVLMPCTVMFQTTFVQLMLVVFPAVKIFIVVVWAMSLCRSLIRGCQRWGASRYQASSGRINYEYFNSESHDINVSTKFYYTLQRCYIYIMRVVNEQSRRTFVVMWIWGKLEFGFWVLGILFWAYIMIIVKSIL
jgi:hypothetical protein